VLSPSLRELKVISIPLLLKSPKTNILSKTLVKILFVSLYINQKESYIQLGVVAYACHPSHLGNGSWRTASSNPAQAKLASTYLKENYKQKG
jgi:hypothetical protein